MKKVTDAGHNGMAPRTPRPMIFSIKIFCDRQGQRLLKGQSAPHPHYDFFEHPDEHNDETGQIMTGRDTWDIAKLSFVYKMTNILRIDPSPDNPPLSLQR